MRSQPETNMNAALNISKGRQLPLTRHTRYFTVQQQYVIEANIDKLSGSKFFSLTEIQVAVLETICDLADYRGRWPPAADVHVPSLAFAIMRSQQSVEGALAALVKKRLLEPEPGGYIVRLPGIVAMEGRQW